eukprot:TRINITY_DN23286_c0_g1_i4.p1 TRINITY_DN23286_c0_g1~~TRINITY_DN23286_c0_g1_i4.p1  ORF type:complete len:119 (-),score=13.28 TRINITY_DN23286_c0_g1_i4:278-634(-)
MREIGGGVMNVGVLRGRCEATHVALKHFFEQVLKLLEALFCVPTGLCLTHHHCHFSQEVAHTLEDRPCKIKSRLQNEIEMQCSHSPTLVHQAPTLHRPLKSRMERDRSPAGNGYAGSV